MLLASLLFLAPAAQVLADFNLVGTLPNSAAVSSDISYAGYYDVDPLNAGANAKLFGWFFPSRNQPSTDPIVLWMTGGPGCSSELAVLFENGPFTVNDQLTLVSNPYSWTNNASVLFVDQPFGTGFSPTATGDVVYNEQQMARYMHAFLIGFFGQFTQYQKLPFFITGESFAGHYIPVLSAYIVQQNLIAQDDVPINLKGSAIGNGWVRPLLQYNYIPFAVANDLVPSGGDQEARLNEWYQQCYLAMVLEEFVQASDLCNLIMSDIVRIAPQIDGYPINHYNIKQPCVEPSLCYNFTDQTNYMNLPQTQQALGVDMVWETCSSRAGLPLTVDRIRSFAQALPVLLSNGIPVLIYNGMLDLICEWMGGQDWLNAMTWDGTTEFAAMSLQDWNVNGQLAGHTKTYNGLTFLAVEEAGHMVPHDQPVAALEMLNTFIFGGTFSSSSAAKEDKVLKLTQD